jgi:isocitrate dehydrogenase
MTKDLAACIYGNQLNESHYLTTESFLEAVGKNLEQALG